MPTHITADTIKRHINGLQAIGTQLEREGDPRWIAIAQAAALLESLRVGRSVIAGPAPLHSLERPPRLLQRSRNRTMRLSTLCNDCLKRNDHATESERQLAHEETIMCECGGQLCGCDFCMGILESLEAGERGTLNGRTCDIKEWTPEGGAK